MGKQKRTRNHKEFGNKASEQFDEVLNWKCDQVKNLLVDREEDLDWRNTNKAWVSFSYSFIIRFQGGISVTFYLSSKIRIIFQIVFEETKKELDLVLSDFIFNLLEDYSKLEI